MFSGLDILTLASTAILTSIGPTQCELPKRTEINVIPKALNVHFDYSKTRDELQTISDNVLVNHGSNGYTIAQGLMRGTVTVKPTVHLKHTHYTSSNMGCAWFDRIDVIIELDPNIMISDEIYEDECRREVVIEHEMKHVRVDREVIDDYTEIMGDHIYDTLERNGFKSEPFAYEKLEGVVAAMQRVVFEAVNETYQQMEQERQTRQIGVDTIEEYERVAQECTAEKRVQRRYHRHQYRYNQ